MSYSERELKELAVDFKKSGYELSNNFWLDADSTKEYYKEHFAGSSFKNYTEKILPTKNPIR